MVSFAFLLCSTLLLSGAIAAPYPEATDEATAVATVATDADPIAENKTLAAEIAQEASQAGIKVLTDILDGKDLQTSLLDRSIEAFGKVGGEIASVGHSFLKRLKELKDGLPLEKVAGKIWKSIQRKFSGKSKNFDEIVKATGVDNLTAFVESATKVIKETITSMIQKRKEAKEIDRKALEIKMIEAACEESAEEVHE